MSSSDYTKGEPDNIISSKVRINFKDLHYFHWTILILSLSLTIFAWRLSKNHTRDKALFQFNRESSNLIDMVKERMTEYEVALWGGVAAIKMHGGNATYPAWKKFHTSLDIKNRFPGIDGIGVIYNVPPHKLDSFLKRQKLYRPDFHIYPKHKQSVFLPITYIEPIESNYRAVGLDMAHENHRYTAAKVARDSGNAQITGPIQLVQSDKQTPGFLFFTPFYEKEMSGIVSIEERRNKFVGMVYAPFTVNRLMKEILLVEKQKIGQRQINIHITDTGNGGPYELYNEKNENYTDYDPNPMFTKEHYINMYGRRWLLTAYSNRTFRSKVGGYQSNVILFCGILIDVLLLILFVLISTANKKSKIVAQKMKKAAEEQTILATESAKLAALGEMAGGVAHEINNPLGIITALVIKMRSMLGKGKPAQEELLDIVDKVDDTVVRISKITNGMKAVARDGSKDPTEKISVREVINDALSICVEKFKGRGLTVEVAIDDDKQEIFTECRRVEISQVIVNLLNNSYDAIKDTDKPWIKINAFAKHNSVVIEVIDSGHGIPKAHQHKILEPFFTTKGVGKGTGLGLSISRKIVEGNNGVFKLDTKCQNTKFLIILPKADNDINTVASKQVA